MKLIEYKLKSDALFCKAERGLPKLTKSKGFYVLTMGQSRLQKC